MSVGEVRQTTTEQASLMVRWDLCYVQINLFRENFFSFRLITSFLIIKTDVVHEAGYIAMPRWRTVHVLQFFVRHDYRINITSPRVFAYILSPVYLSLI